MNSELSFTHLFPTRIAQSTLGDEALREDLRTICASLCEDDTAGLSWSEREAYPGYTSYASLEDLCDRFSVFELLRLQLKQAAGAFVAAAHWDMGDKTLSLDHIWVNVLAPGGVHSGHIHPGSVISGTYYVEVPDDSSRLKFEDPRLAQMMAAPPLNEFAPPEEARFFYLTPKSGEVVLWESWLRHEVTENMSDTPRVSVSFNFSQT